MCRRKRPYLFHGLHENRQTYQEQGDARYSEHSVSHYPCAVTLTIHGAHFNTSLCQTIAPCIAPTPYRIPSTPAGTAATCAPTAMRPTVAHILLVTSSPGISSGCG